MKKVLILTLLTFCLVACSATQSDEDEHFWDPIRSFNELEAMHGDYELTNFIEKYSFLTIELDSIVHQVDDIIWINNQFLIADSLIGDIYIMDSNFEVNNTIKNISSVPTFFPRALATDSTGKLYALTSSSSSTKETNFSILVFDEDFIYEKSIMFTINSHAELITPKSIVVNPHGGFLFTLEMSSDVDDGKIYFISDDGQVTGSLGNKSFGFLIELFENIYFVNGNFGMSFNRDTGEYRSNHGISSLINIHNGNAVDSVVLPPVMSIPHNDDVIQEWIEVYAEINGELPTYELVEDIREFGHYIIMTIGSGGLFLIGDTIAVVAQIGNVLHVFDTDLNYLYSHRLDNGYVEFYREFMTNGHEFSLTIAACADDNGNIFLAQRVTGDSVSYRILVGKHN